ncbi:MAG: hypothetical protein CMA92_00215 [Euryarchaeota archaeon]|nr:hypothetical protein [Euryarchaeota archaeon]|tara:strand:- start:1356 stop:2135 length:780 start_codon:yes stop_codon:yes gene_type:complete
MSDIMSSDEIEFDEEDIIQNASLCENCDDITEHEVLKEKLIGQGRDLLLKCTVCSKISTLLIRAPKSIRIPFILTEGPNSQKITIDIDSDEEFRIGDVFEEDDKLWSVNQILISGDRKAKMAQASEVTSISALRTDMVIVKLTMTRGEFSDSQSITVEHGKKFTAGHLMEHAGETWRIRAIHTGEGRTMKGTVESQFIKRIYLHEPPNTQHFEPKTPRERRQAWKEGRLGYNPNPIIPKEVTKKRVRPTNKRKKKRPRN